MAMATTRDAELGQKRPMTPPNWLNSGVLVGLEATSTRLAAQGRVTPPHRPNGSTGRGPAPILPRGRLESAVSSAVKAGTNCLRWHTARRALP